MKMQFAFAIPTFNRCAHLKRAVDSIKSQVVDSEICISIIISNSSSSDGTYQYIQELLAEESPINFIAHNAEVNDEAVVPFEENWRKLSTLIPPEIDWVWTLGDDDYLYQTGSLSVVCDLIRKHKDQNLGFLHACQARRSHNSGKAFVAPLHQLCNNIGFHEMLGWMSSNICKREISIAALTRSVEQKLTGKNSKSETSAYPHAAGILKKAYAENAIFLDLPLVEPQDETQTKESMARWRDENIGERYLYLIDDLREIREETDIPKFSKTFFRYLTYSLWDRFIIYQFGQLLDDSRTPEEKSKPEFTERLNGHWGRIASLVEMMGDPYEQKCLALQCRSAVDLSNMWIMNGFESPVLKDLLRQTSGLASKPIYDFRILQN